MDNIETIKEIEQKERMRLSTLEEKHKEAIEIQETIYLGKIKDKEVYRLVELDNRDNYTAAIYKYFDENTKLQGIKNIGLDGQEEWIYLGEEWEQIKDEIDKNEVQLEEQIAEILAELGISEGDIQNITELDLRQKINENELDDDKVNPDEEPDKDPEEDQGKKNKEENEPESKATSKYTNTLNEIDTNKFVDQKGTELGEALGLEEYGYTKLLIVHADNVRDIKDAEGNHQGSPTKKLAILGVREEDGKEVVEKIPEDVLDYDRRTNQQSVRFDDNNQVEKNAGTYERFVNPKTNRGIGIEMSEMETKVYYQGDIDRDDNTAVMGRIEDARTGWVEAETKEVFNYNHGWYKADKVNTEMETHEKDGGQEIERENADGDLNTVSGHIHQLSTPDDKIAYQGEVLRASEVANKMEIPLVVFMQKYNEQAKILQGEEGINLDNFYKEIGESAKDEQEKAPKREEGGRTPGEYEDPRPH